MNNVSANMRSNVSFDESFYSFVLRGYVVRINVIRFRVNNRLKD